MQTSLFVHLAAATGVGLVAIDLDRRHHGLSMCRVLTTLRLKVGMQGTLRLQMSVAERFLRLQWFSYQRQCGSFRSVHASHSTQWDQPGPIRLVITLFPSCSGSTSTDSVILPEAFV